MTTQQQILKLRAVFNAGSTKNTVINTGVEDEEKKPSKPRKRRVKKDGKQ